jgi:16S rRNA (uracil1498-N3)-methyltransferase
MPRFYCPAPLATDEVLDLAAGAARHVQVLRLQPGDGITLFNGLADAPQIGGEFEATVLSMGRSSVTVQVGAHHPVEREAARAVHLVVGMPANERMDWLVEKATELGVASIQPLMTERSVLRLSHERAEKKQAHWQSIAIAACEQCGRNQVPVVHAVMGFAQWAKTMANAQRVSTGYLLSLRGDSRPLRDVLHASLASNGAELKGVAFLSGPEGGLSESEEQAALDAGFTAVSLGARVLRAETAALAALTLLA